MYFEDYSWALVRLSNNLSVITQPLHISYVMADKSDFIIGVKYHGAAICHMAIPKTSADGLKIYTAGADISMGNMIEGRTAQSYFLELEAFKMIQKNIMRASNIDFEGFGEKVVDDLRQNLKRGANVP